MKRIIKNRERRFSMVGWAETSDLRFLLVGSRKDTFAGR